MDDLRYWVGFSLIRGLGAVRFRLLLDSFGDLAKAWQAGYAALKGCGLATGLVEQIVYQRQRIDPAAELARVARAGLNVVTWNSPSFPRLLSSIDNPPPVLYYRGELRPQDELAVALVGTRSPSVAGKEVAARLAYDLAQNGVTVVSGLALGIDAVAHREALRAGGRTLAVLGCGLDSVYPSSHRALADKIVTSGALLSDYALGVKPEARNFPPRNRLISGLALGTVVVEAGIRSGALITLQFALEQGRETFAVPGNVQSRSAMGTNAAIQKGHAKLVTCVQDILEELNISMIQEQRQARAVLPEGDEERALWGYLGEGPVHIDELVRRSGLPTAQVSSTLMLMELKGMVRCVDRTSYMRGQS